MVIRTTLHALWSQCKNDQSVVAQNGYDRNWETLPRADRPIQFLNGVDEVRSIHGISYTRLWNSELLDVVGQFESEFQPPKPAQYHHGTGLYAGEQDTVSYTHLTLPTTPYV